MSDRVYFDHLYLVQLASKQYKKLHKLLKSNDAMSPRRISPDTEATLIIQVLIPGKKISAFRKSDIHVKVLEDVTETFRERMSEVGKGDRFASKRVIPSGPGKKE